MQLQLQHLQAHNRIILLVSFFLLFTGVQNVFSQVPRWLTFSSRIWTEAGANDGTINNSSPITIIVEGLEETFTGTNGSNFVAEGKVLVTNIPSGLTVVMTKTSSTVLEVTITGSAASHTSANNISDLTFTFQDAAFTGGDAAGVNDYSTSDLQITFLNPPRIYVTVSGAGTKDGSDWGNAYDGTQLQTAIDKSGVTQVWVAKGTYNPTKILPGYEGEPDAHCFKMYTMKNGVAIYGGFVGTETALSQRTDFRMGQANETKLSGDIGNPGDIEDNCHIIVMNSGLYNSAVLDGFMIRDANNRFFLGGGGMINDQSSPTISNCTFTSNVGYDGGAMLNAGPMDNSTGSSPVITNCVFTDNTSYTSGGAICNFQFGLNNPTLTNCIIVNNVAQYGGGILNNSPASTTLTLNNCTIANNEATEDGGGIYGSFAGAAIILNNCILWGNTAPGVGANQMSLESSSVTLNYSCYSNGTNDIYNLAGTFTATNHNITSPPQFVNASGKDYRVMGASPCVDLGSDGYNSESYDIRGSGYARKLNKTNGAVGTVDMGAYEYKPSADPLPVELFFFTATSAANKATLVWRTVTELDNVGFEVERRKADKQMSPRADESAKLLNGLTAQWLKIGFVQGAGTCNSPKNYSYTDASASSGKYSYRLKQIDIDGNFKYSQEAEVTIEVPCVFALSQNYPNPFNPSTTIEFTLVEDSKVSLKVFDMLGREVETLVNGDLKAGELHSVFFDASKLSSGTYFYRLDYGANSLVKKLVLMK